MTPQEILKEVAALPESDWITIQQGIADMMVARFSPEELAEIEEALAESEAELARGEGLSSAEIRKQLGLT